MNKIRKYAKDNNHKIIGKLTRRPDWEYIERPFDCKLVHTGCKHYSDEGGNEYIIGPGGICIVTVEDVII